MKRQKCSVSMKSICTKYEKDVTNLYCNVAFGYFPNGVT